MNEHAIQCNIIFNFNNTVTISMESEVDDDKTLEILAMTF